MKKDLEMTRIKSLEEDVDIERRETESPVSTNTEGTSTHSRSTRLFQYIPKLKLLPPHIVLYLWNVKSHKLKATARREKSRVLHRNEAPGKKIGG